MAAVKTRTWKDTYCSWFCVFVPFPLLTHAFALRFSELSLTQYFTRNPKFELKFRQISKLDACDSDNYSFLIFCDQV